MLKQQMDMFEEGGLKDQGGSVDPISGNDVPIGSTKEEVRDDIPAQLSEGEFVFPADVVRYVGLQNLMQMRQQAKMGLKEMEDMGQMGNSEEATMPDDLPFDMNDIDIEDEEEYNSANTEEQEMAQGGLAYAPGGVTTKTNTLGSQTSQFDNTATRTAQPKKYVPPPLPTAAPKGGFKYGSGAAPKGKATFDGLFKETGGADSYKTYVNDAGSEIQVPFKNGKVLTGFTIPEGFKLKTEKVDTAKTQSTKTKTSRVQQESGSDDPDVRDTQAVVSLGGEIDPRTGRVVGTAANPLGSYAFSVNPPKGMGINVITMGKMIMGGITGNYPEGTSINLQPVDSKGNPIGGKVTKLDAKAYVEATRIQRNGKSETSITNPKARELNKLLSVAKDFDMVGKDGVTFKDLQNAVGTKEAEAIREANIKESDKFIKDDGYTPTSSDDDDTQGGGTGTVVPGGISYVGEEPVDDSTTFTTPTSPASQPSSNTSSGYSDQGPDDDYSDSPSDTNNDSDSFGDMSGMDFNTGGLAGKKKKKKMKMKRGGLASRK